MQGWLKLHRKITDWKYFKSHKHLVTWLTILSRAAHTEVDLFYNERNVRLNPGQCIIGRKEFSKALGISEQNLRTVLFNLENDGQINQQKTTKYTIITVTNWQDYQETNQQLTNKQPTGNQQVTTKKNDKNEKNEREDNSPDAPKWLRRFKFGELKKQSDFVWLTDQHIDKLLELMVNEQELKHWIKQLDNYLFNKPKAYSDHAATIKKWWEKQIGSGWTWKLNTKTQLWQYMKEY